MVTAQDALTDEFEKEMLNIFQRAFPEAHYNRGKRLLAMLHEHGGLDTARLLIHSPTVSEGYSALSVRGRLYLTVEAVIHDNPKWHPLFTEEELAICNKRLREYG